MTIGTILVIVAAILVVVGMLVGFNGPANGAAPRYRRPYAILGVAVLLICIALFVGVEPFVRT